jgi:hypothetical protein
VDVVSQRLQAFDGRRRQDAVAEIEYMSGSAAGLVQDVVGSS